MSISTFPVWLEILSVGIILLVFAGLFTPYVSAEDQEKARRVPKIAGTTYAGEKLPIKIRNRIELGTVMVRLVPALLGMVDAVYLVESSRAAVEAIGLGKLSGYVIVVFGMVLVDMTVWIGIMVLVALAASWVERDLARYYADHYNVTVVCDTEGIEY